MEGVFPRIPSSVRHLLLQLAILGLALAASTHHPLQPPPGAKLPSDASIRAAKAFLDQHPVFDGHNDLPYKLRKHLQNNLNGFNLDQDLRKVEPWASGRTHTDLPRMREGRLGGQFWAAYVGCDSQYKDAIQLTLEQADVIRRMAEAYPNDMAFCTTADEVEAAMASGKVASLIGMESGHGINSNLAVLRALYEFGVRYMTLTHGCNTPWADAAQVEMGTLPVRSKGLSDFGETVVHEMNRLGMLVDISHVSSKTMKDVLAVARAPVIFSHSSARALCSHPRNVPDDVLKLVAGNGGVVMVNLYSSYLNDNSSLASVGNAVAHINHIRDICGVKCVGIGADYDGVDYFPEELRDVSTYPVLFAALMEDGSWMRDDLAMLAQGNVLRAMRAAETVRDQMSGDRPSQERLDESEWQEGETGCMSQVDKHAPASASAMSAASMLATILTLAIQLIGF